MLVKKGRQICGRLEKLGKKNERILIWLFFSGLVFGVLVLTGTPVSGFHLVDDWEYAQYVDRMSPGRSRFWDCMRETVACDLTMRFRPFYYICRVCAAAIFGIDLTAMSVIKGAEIAAASVGLYYCARHMRCSVVRSAVFSLTVMMGYQSAVWWKLGPQESFGMTLFAGGFYLMLTWLESGKRWRAVCSVGLFFLMSVYKETFLLLFPFLMLYVVYERMRGKKITAFALWEAVRENGAYLLAVGLIFAAELFLLVFVIGTNNYSYVGLDSHMTYEQYKAVWQTALGKDLKWYFRFGVVLFMILLTYWERLKKLGWEMALALSVVLPQIVAYSKPGIGERYILPAVFGFAFFFVIKGFPITGCGGRRRAVYALCLLLMLAAHARVTLREARYFAYRGNSVQSMLETVLDYTEKYEDAKVLSCFSPNLEGNKTMYYWLRIHGYDDVFYWDEDRRLISKWFGEHEDEVAVLEQMDVVVMYNREDRHWCYEPSLDLSDFTEQKCGTLTLYFRNE